ncbi:hypothetical protein SNE40_019783 [Patella caerulea]|uniref:Uncharacterized protein n=1 Tax=Patella caerulea TaxID=87958 RepID=A0AAN8G1J4_PATCE
MANNGYEHSGFKGFVANRFGRVAELAKEFLKRRSSIIAFFNAVVDENANKLVLAVATFIQCDWFICCAEVYSMLGEWVIFPLMNILGIDDKSSQKNPSRNWEGVRDFFHEKIPELEALRDGPTETGKDMLISAVLEEVVETLNRQLSEMSYFKDSNNSPHKIDEQKLKYAPMTNLGCESEFAKLDNRIRVSGGSTSVTTHSRKNVVATNAFLVDTAFTELSENERLDRWTWARRSEEVKKVKNLEASFLETVKASNILALQKKEEMKKKKHERSLKLLETYKEHGGPITENTLNLLGELTERQLLAEVGYLRVTLAPDIRQKRRIRSDCGKYKMQSFSKDELKSAIRNVIKPESDVSNDIDRLLLSVF